MHEQIEHQITTHDGTIAAVDYGGEGPDVVLIHGGNRTLLDWTPIRERLSGTRLIAYDLRGHGHSSVPVDADYSFAGHQRDLEEVIEYFGLSGPYLVGHSIGGNVAVRAAGTGVPIAGAISLDGYGPGVYDGSDREQRRQELDAEIYEHLEPDSLPEDQVPALIDRFRAMMKALDADEALARPCTLRSLAPGSPGWFERRPPMSHQAALAAGLEELDFFALVEAAECPVLIVKSDQPTPTGHLSPRSQQYVAALEAGTARALEAADADLEHAHVIRVDAGHMLLLQRPAEVATLIEEFVGRRSGA